MLITGNFFLDLVLICIPIALLIFWWTGMKAKDIAIQHARKLCNRESVQLLDYTVALKHIKPARKVSGASAWRREYQFDFTVHGEHRDQGTVTLLGHTLVHSYLPYIRDESGNRVFVH